jgi:hypothetical protein
MAGSSLEFSNTKLFRGWLVACTVAQVFRVSSDWLASLVLSAIVAGSGYSDAAAFAILLVSESISGALAGIAQWIVLRQRLTRVKSWVIASSLGSAAGLVINSILEWWNITSMRESLNNLNDFLDIFVGVSPVPPIVVVVISGSVLGLTQWVVLSRQVPHSGWWVIASSVGTIGGWAVAGTLQQILGQAGLYSGAITDPAYWVTSMIDGVVYGGITGVVLVWLVQRVRSTEDGA